MAPAHGTALQRDQNLPIFRIGLARDDCWLAPTAAAPPRELQAIRERQPELLQRALRELMVSTSQPQLNFIGFAGYGRESVLRSTNLATIAIRGMRASGSSRIPHGDTYGCAQGLLGAILPERHLGSIALDRAKPSECP